MKLNYGCGETNLEGYINVDTAVGRGVSPNLLCDIKRGHLPFDKEAFEEINALHVLEHIEQRYWPLLFEEFKRVLKVDGRLNLAWPDFEICARNFIDNFKGARDFWRMTLYGRQEYPGDYHIVPMRTPEVLKYLSSYGFKDIKYGPEVDEEWSVFLTCLKSSYIPPTRVELYKKEVFA